MYNIELPDMFATLAAADETNRELILRQFAAALGIKPNRLRQKFRRYLKRKIDVPRGKLDAYEKKIFIKRGGFATQRCGYDLRSAVDVKRLKLRQAEVLKRMAKIETGWRR